MKGINIFMLVMIVSIMSFSLTQAVEVQIKFFHPINTNLTISETCRVNGAICGTSFTCNITVLDPINRSRIVDNQLMTFDSPYYTFNLNESQTSLNGVYESTVDCTNTTLSGGNTFFYELTPNGSPPIDTGQGFLIISGILALIVISIFLAFLGVRSNNVSIHLGFIFLSVILLVYTVGLVFNTIALSFGTFGGIVSNFSTVYVLFVTLLGMGVLGLIIFILVLALRKFSEMRGLR